MEWQESEWQIPRIPHGKKGPAIGGQEQASPCYQASPIFQETRQAAWTL